MTSNRAFTSGVAWIAAGNWIEQGVSFVLFLILARLLGAEAFGVMAMASVFVTLAEFLVRESVSEGIIALKDPTGADYNAAFWLLVAFGFLLFAAVALASPALARFYGEPDIARLVPWLMSTVPMIAVTAVPVAILRRELRFKTLAVRAIAGVVVGGIVGIGMALAGYGVWSLLGQRVAVVATNIALAWVAVDWRPGLTTGRENLRKAAALGGSVIGLRAAELAAAQAPVLLIGATLGPVATGLFSVASRIVDLLSFLIVTPLRVASQPVFAALNRQGGRADDLLASLARFTGLLGFPLFAGVAFLAQPFIEVTIGPKWAEAAPVLAILSLVGANACIDRVQQSFCLAAGRAAQQSLAAWAVVAIGTLLGWLALPYGLWAVALGFAAAHWIVWPWRVAITARIAGLPSLRLAAPHAAPLALSAAMAAAVVAAEYLFAPGSAGAELALGMLTGTAAALALAALFLRDRILALKGFLLRPAGAAEARPEAPAP
ncbi:MAG: lipopolysaccharide biosynthesis protein [Paracoccaceae bacterium]